MILLCHCSRFVDEFVNDKVSFIGICGEIDGLDEIGICGD